MSSGDTIFAVLLPDPACRTIAYCNLRHCIGALTIDRADRVNMLWKSYALLLFATKSFVIMRASTGCARRCSFVRDGRYRLTKTKTLPTFFHFCCTTPGSCLLKGIVIAWSHIVMGITLKLGGPVR